MPLLEASGGFLHISGAKVSYDPTKPVSERVLAISIFNPTTKSYEALDLAKTYYLATNDFLAAGGDGYTMLGGAREEGPSMDSVFAEYLKIADLKAYDIVNPNACLIAIKEADYKKRLTDETETPYPPQPEGPTHKNGKGVYVDDLSTGVVPPSDKEPVSNVSNVQSKANSNAATSKEEQLPKTASQSELSISLFGFALAGLGLVASRRRKEHA